MAEERKLVTVLFADIVNSTTMTTSSEPEVIRAVLAREFEKARAIVQRHGGTVEKFIGDEIMAVFGAPSSHDDDAERAVRAAFAMREDVSSTFRLRVGVNTGEVLAGNASADQALVTGAPVIAAARIRQSAEPGEILVGELTRRLSASVIDYSSARPIIAKGLGNLIVYRAEALLSPLPGERRVVPRARGPLIARNSELRLLRETLRRVAAERTPYAVTIYGTAGVGKSRLLSEFLQRERDAEVVRGRCLPYGDAITWWPLQEVLRAEASISLSLTAEESHRRLRERVVAVFGGETPEATAVSDGLLHILSPRAGGEVDDSLLTWSIGRYFEQRAADRAVVLAVEDIHWAEPALLSTLERLISTVRAPLLLLCLARPELLESQPSWMAGRRNAAAVELSRLRNADALKMIATIPDASRVSPELRGRIVATAEGNPLFIEELLRMVTDAPARPHVDAGGPAGHASDVPASLHAVIAARLDQLPGRTKAMLQGAAIIGRVFWTDALHVLAGDATDRLDEAVERDFVEPVDERGMRGGRGYKFKHVLIREVAYASTHKAVRLTAHDSLAAWLQQSAGDRVGEFTEVIAHHAEQAARLAFELEDARGSALAQRAIAALRTAIEGARARLDDASVLSLGERAMSLCMQAGLSSVDRSEIGAMLALARVSREPDESAIAELEAQLRTLRRMPPNELVVHVLTVLSDNHLVRGNQALASALAEEATTIAREIGTPVAVGEALIALWRISNVAGRYEEMFERVQAAVRHFREHDLRLPRGANPFFPLSRMLANRGELAEAVAVRREGIAIVRLRAWLGGADPAAHAEGMSARWIGDLELAAEKFREAARYAEARGLSGVGSNDELGDVLYELGEYAESERWLRESVIYFERTANRAYLPEDRWRLSRSLLALGRLDEAREQADRARVEVLPGDHHAAGYTAAALAAARAAESNFEEADALYREALDELATGNGLALAAVRTEYAKVLMSQRRFDEARRFLELVRDFYHEEIAWRRRRVVEELLTRCAELAAR